MKKKIFVFLLSVGVLSSCATREGYQGALIGGAAGSAIGSAIDEKNPWRGAFIGGILGATIVGTVADISAQAAQESARYDQTIVYECRRDCVRPVKIIAVPVGRGRGRCKLIKIKYFEDGQLVKVKTEKICVRR
jgi:hypothetical protein